MSAPGQSLDQFLRQQFDVLQYLRDNFDAIQRVANHLTPVEDLQDLKDEIDAIYPRLGLLVEASDLIIQATGTGLALLTAADVPAQRAALGLGTAALRAEGYFATAENLTTTLEQLNALSDLVDVIGTTLVSKAGQGALDALDLRVTAIENNFTTSVEVILNNALAFWATDVLASVDASVGALTTTVTNIDGRLVAETARNDALAAQVTAVDASIAGYGTAIQALQTHADDLDGWVTSTSDAITELQADVTNAREQLEAQATAVDALTTSVTNNEALSELTAAQTTVLTGRITDAEAGIEAETLARQALDTRLTEGEGTIDAIATEVTELHAGLTSVGNLLWNAGFETGVQSWEMFSVGDDWGNATMTRNMVATGVLPALLIQNTLAGFTPTDDTGVRSLRIPVEELKTYIVSGYIGATNCTARLEFRTYNAAGDMVDADLVGSANTPLPALFSNWAARRIFTAVPIPLGTAFLEVQFWAMDPTGAQPKAWLSRGQVEEAVPGQTLPSPWTPAVGGIGTISADAVSALEAHITVLDGDIAALASDVTDLNSAITDPVTGLTAQATAQAALETQVTSHNGSITTLLAQYTLRLDVNGRVVGWKFINDGTTGIADFVADVFRITAPAGYKSVEFKDGVMISQTGTYARYMGVQFGTPANFIDWFGPKPVTGPIGALEANGLFWIKDDGSAYFGGNLASGSVLTFSGGSGVNLLPDKFSTFDATSAPTGVDYSSCTSGGLVTGKITKAMRITSTGVASDSLFASVMSELHFNGADASTTMSDVKGLGWTVAGNAQIDNTNADYGNALMLDGAGDYIQVTTLSTAFNTGSGDFCAEITATLNNFTATNSAGPHLMSWGDDAGNIEARVFLDTSGHLRMAIYDAGSYKLAVTDSVLTLATGTKYKIAFERTGNTYRVYVNGAIWITSTIAAWTMTAGAMRMIIGAALGGIRGFVNGWLDEFRFTKASRYNGAYSPATAEFPDAGGTGAPAEFYFAPQVTNLNALAPAIAGQKYVVSAFVKSSVALAALTDIKMVLKGDFGTIVEGACKAAAVGSTGFTRVSAIVDTTGFTADDDFMVAYPKFTAAAGTVVDIDGIQVEKLDGTSNIPGAYSRGTVASVALAAAIAAANAQATADTAATDAATSLNQLSDIASDSKLTANEKLVAKANYLELTGEQAGIVASATVRGIGAALTAYTAAITALQVYLNGAGLVGAGPAYTWTSITGTTTIVRATWDSTWAAAYYARQTLLNTIAAPEGIGEDMVANGSFEANAVNGVATTAPAVGTAVCDAWEVVEVVNTAGWRVSRDTSAARVRSGTYSLFMQSQNGVNLPVGASTFLSVGNQKKFQVIEGERFQVKGMVTEDFTAALPANINRKIFFGLRYYNAAGAVMTGGGVLFDQTATRVGGPGAVDTQLWEAIVTIPTGAVSAQVACYCSITNNTAAAYALGAELVWVRFDDIMCIKWGRGNALTEAGSAQQIGDLRNINPSGFGNLGGVWLTAGGVITYSAAAGTPATATISVTAATLRLAGVDIGYNATSVGVTGTNGATVTYLLYFDDPTFIGGARTLGATTTFDTLLNSLNRVYLGKVTVVYPASGTSGGSGGKNCVTTRSLLDCNRRAGDMLPGYATRVVDPLTGDQRQALCTYSEMFYEECVRMRWSNGVVLECSLEAPIPVGDQLVPAKDCHGATTLTKLWTGEIQEAEVVSIDYIGLQPVQHLTIEDTCFWAGDDSGTGYAAHHNIKADPNLP